MTFDFHCYRKTFFFIKGGKSNKKINQLPIKILKNLLQINFSLVDTRNFSVQ
jgi:hypothetical protein